MSRTPDEQVLLASVPENGDAVGNTFLIRQLEWDPEKYWRIRERLLANGTLVRGRGKGGSVSRWLAQANGSMLPRCTKISQLSETESDLYKPLLQVLKSDWVREMRIEPEQIYFEITAKQGRKSTGGTWTRPDISAVSVRTFQHLPNKYLDIWTFEVKPVDGLDVTAVFEAAAHGSRATRSYALLQVPNKLSADAEEVLRRCDREAERLRVGLVTFTDPSTFDTWETRVEAPRVDTDPESLEEFIAQLSDEAKKRLARWK